MQKPMAALTLRNLWQHCIRKVPPLTPSTRPSFWHPRPMQRQRANTRCDDWNRSLVSLQGTQRLSMVRPPDATRGLAGRSQRAHVQRTKQHAGNGRLEETAATGEGSTDSQRGGGAARPARFSGGELDVASNASRNGSSVAESSGSQRSSQDDAARGKSGSSPVPEAKYQQQSAAVVDAPPPLIGDGNGLSTSDGFSDDQAMVDCLLWDNLMDSTGAGLDGSGLQPSGSQTLFDDMATEQGGCLGVTMDEVQALFADGVKTAAAAAGTATGLTAAAGESESETVRAAKVPATGDRPNSGGNAGVISSVPSNSPQRYEANRTISPPSSARKTSMEEPVLGSKRNAALSKAKVSHPPSSLSADMPLAQRVRSAQVACRHAKPETFVASPSPPQWALPIAQCAGTVAEVCEFRRDGCACAATILLLVGARPPVGGAASCGAVGALAGCPCRHARLDAGPAEHAHVGHADWRRPCIAHGRLHSVRQRRVRERPAAQPGDAGLDAGAAHDGSCHGWAHWHVWACTPAGGPAASFVFGATDVPRAIQQLHLRHGSRLKRDPRPRVPPQEPHYSQCRVAGDPGPHQPE